MTADNPLLTMLDNGDMPDFERIRAEHAEPAIDHLLAAARATIEQCVATAAPTWAALIAPIDDAEERISHAFAPVSHMHSVMDAPAWREAFQNCIAKLTDFNTEQGQNRALYAAVQKLRDSDEYDRLDAGQQRVIDNMLRDFRLSGVALEGEARERYRAIARRLSELSTQFQQNLLDATQAWTKHVTERAALAGLPDSALGLLAQNAEQQELEGWLITLDAPSFIAVMQHADDRTLRAELYEAFATRASDVGPHAGAYDNSALMDEILALRHEAAALLGFDNYAEQSLATKMADTPAQIETFLQDLATRSRATAEQELADLQALAAEDGVAELQSWDVAYYGDKLKHRRYDLSDEDLRPYFPAPAVIDGLFRVVERLYDLRIRANTELPVWHEDVTVYDLFDADGAQRGRFYLDPYARQGKRGGAWMADVQSRRVRAGAVQLPVAFVTCNFAPPIGDDPALLSHSEVTTLFHEFGHALHHMLTQIDYTPIAGIAGVEWDAVELPSQFMENWCWARASLDLFARHYQTGEKLPAALFDKLHASRNHMAGWQMLRQIEFSPFDLRLHRDHDPATGARVAATLAAVRDEVAVLQPPDYNRFPQSFAHIFAGGYAAGYYSYKWAEVLSADAFSAFEETDLFDADTGARFRGEILERGGSRDAADSFRAFRGREPSIDALLRHSGLTDEAA